MPRINNFLNPSISLFSSCPNCKHLIPVKSENDTFYIGENNCKHCGVEINGQELIEGFIKNFVTTQAISSANSILGLDLAAIIFLAVSIFIVAAFVFFPLPIFILYIIFAFNTLVYAIPIYICIRWLIKFGNWKIEDKEFIESKKNIKKSLTFWIVAHFLVIIVFLYKYLE